MESAAFFAPRKMWRGFAIHAAKPSGWRIRPTIIALILLLGSPSGAFADLIKFRDGSRLRGKVLKQTPNEVTVQLDFGNVVVSTLEILSIEIGDRPEVPPAGSTQPGGNTS
jgi:hypothetical protein